MTCCRMGKSSRSDSGSRAQRLTEVDDSRGLVVSMVAIFSNQQVFHHREHRVGDGKARKNENCKPVASTCIIGCRYVGTAKGNVSVNSVSSVVNFLSFQSNIYPWPTI